MAHKSGIAGTAIFENLLDQRELSAVELSRKIGGNLHASLGLGDLGFQPLFHRSSPSVNLQA